LDKSIPADYEPESIRNVSRATLPLPPFNLRFSRILWKCGRPTELYPANSLPIRLSGMVFSCGYFFSAAFQFTTTFNGGEEAAQVPAGVSIRKHLPSAVTS